VELYDQLPKGFASYKEKKEMVNEIPAAQLHWICDPQVFKFNTSEEIVAPKTIFGQERAANSLRFGLGIKAEGFNIYVAGMPGTGRTSMVEHFLEQIAKDQPTSSDWCYVNNFMEPSRPEAVCLPTGSARQFQQDIRTLMESVKRELRRVFESEEYAARRKETASTFQQKGEEIIARVSNKAEQEGFLIQQSPTGIMIVPIKNGRPLSQEEFTGLTAEEKEAISAKQKVLQEEIETATRQARSIEKSAGEELDQMDRQVALFALGHLLENLTQKYKDLEEVVNYLNAVRDDILANLDQFIQDPQEQPQAPFPGTGSTEPPFKRYEVNVLVDNSHLMGAPVVLESNPTPMNLFGRIENEAQFGAVTTHFSLIRKGALHRANGGYLVLPIAEVMHSTLAWEGLKRALKNREVVIEDTGEAMGVFSTRSLQPQPIPLDIKVILIGQPDVYQALTAYDENFSELFKVKADFDTQMERTDEHIQDYTYLVSTVCTECGLKHLEKSALAKLVEYGSRLAEDQTKLSTRFGEIADVIREASYYAALENAPYVTGQHVLRTIEEKHYRSNLYNERLKEMTQRGTFKFDVQGGKIGQVNGLSVICQGTISFGHPSRITVSVGAGNEGVLDIEREAKMGGPIHTKGVMILTGYLIEKYAQDKPLSLSARLVFEQSYSGVEGDSASSTELYAILSSLAGVPIKQGIAVTGSVNQKGEVQAIGGVNEKVEGFFEVCKGFGLTGEQGVIIPASNVTNLMLKEEVVEAVKNGQFHLWSVSSIDEGIEILTGVKAGQKKKDGTYEEETIHHRVDERLRQLAQVMDDSRKEDKRRPGRKPRSE
jgi:lon-related putative ATP-dependent protease